VQPYLPGDGIAARGAGRLVAGAPRSMTPIG